MIKKCTYSKYKKNTLQKERTKENNKKKKKIPRKNIMSKNHQVLNSWVSQYGMKERYSHIKYRFYRFYVYLLIWKKN